MMAVKTPLQRRALRLNRSFPVVFCGPQGVVRGQSLNLSESGLLASFGEELGLCMEGELRIAAGVLCHAQRVRVARIREREAGFAFVFAHSMERQAMQELLAVAEQRPWLIGAPLSGMARELGRRETHGAGSAGQQC